MYDDIVKLRRLLRPTGDFSICRKDGTPMSLPDQMLFGDLFVRIDFTLERHLTSQYSGSKKYCDKCQSKIVKTCRCGECDL